MFFLRCAFWLSIVYSSMSWTTGGPHPHSGLQAAETPFAQTGGVIDHALAGASELCHRHATQCLSDAARLTSLFTAADSSTQASADNDRAASSRAATAARRRVHDAKLARAS